MRGTVIRAFLASLFLLLLPRAVTAFDFQPAGDSLVGTPGTRSLFPSNARITSGNAQNSIDSYKFVDPQDTSLRVMASTYTWGMGDNRFSCVDLKTGSIVWSWNLDSSVVEVLQTKNLAFALTFRSLYAFDLETGKPRWQINARSGQRQHRISVSRTEQKLRLGQSEEKSYLEGMGIARLSFIAFNASAGQLVMSLEDNSLIAISSDGTVTAKEEPFEETQRSGRLDSIRCLFSSRDAVYAFYADRLLRRLGRNLVVDQQVYFPEHSIKGIGEFSKSVLIAGGDKHLVYSWDLSTSTIRAGSSRLPEITFATKTRDGDFLVSTVKGLMDIDTGSLVPKWTFLGDRLTVWIAIIPLSIRQHSWQIWSFSENGRRQKLLISGNNLVVVDADTGKQVSQTILPVTHGGSGMLQLVSSLFGSFSVPPFIEASARRIYLPLTEITGKVNSQMNAQAVANHIVEISW